MTDRTVDVVKQRSTVEPRKAPRPATIADVQKAVQAVQREIAVSPAPQLSPRTVPAQPHVEVDLSWKWLAIEVWRGAAIQTLLRSEEHDLAANAQSIAVRAITVAKAFVAELEKPTPEGNATELESAPSKTVDAQQQEQASP